MRVFGVLLQPLPVPLPAGVAVDVVVTLIERKDLSLRKRGSEPLSGLALGAGAVALHFPIHRALSSCSVLSHPRTNYEGVGLKTLYTYFRRR